MFTSRNVVTGACLLVDNIGETPHYSVLSRTHHIVSGQPHNAVKKSCIIREGRELENSSKVGGTHTGMKEYCSTIGAEGLKRRYYLARTPATNPHKQWVSPVSQQSHVSYFLSLPPYQTIDSITSSHHSDSRMHTLLHQFSHRIPIVISTVHTVIVLYFTVKVNSMLNR